MAKKSQVKTLDLDTTTTLRGLGTLVNFWVPGEETDTGRTYENAYVFLLDNGERYFISGSWSKRAYVPDGRGGEKAIWPVVTDAAGNKIAQITTGMKVAFIRYRAFDRDGRPIWSTDSEGNLRINPRTGEPYQQMYTVIRCAEPEFLDDTLEYRDWLHNRAREQWVNWEQTCSETGEPVYPVDESVAF